MLDENGNLREAGYARSLLRTYDPRQVRGGLGRLKEWDYYLVQCGDFALALTIADNTYMGLYSVSLLDFQAGWEVTKSKMEPLTLGKTALPRTSAVGNTAVAGREFGLSFLNDGKKRLLVAHMDNFRDGAALDAQVELDVPPAESIVMMTPFRQRGHFYYNQKINCLPAKGRVELGERRYDFPAGASFGVLDWGRGVWPYQSTWYWASASGTLDGVPFGFNLGYGFGDTSAATENALFYGGRLHKLSQVTFHIPFDGTKEVDYCAPWTFTSDDHRFHCHFVPTLERASCVDVRALKSDQHQVFGRFTGTAVLDDGTVLHLKDFFGFAEKVMNRW